MNRSGITEVDIASLRRMRWSELERAALEAGIGPDVIRRAQTRDELRRAILLARSES